MKNRAILDQRPTTNDQRPTTNDPSLWQKIWSSKGSDTTARDILANHTTEEIVTELKRLDGFDSVGFQLPFEAYNHQYIQIRNELSFGSLCTHELKSVFEVGCGSGAELFLFQQDGIKTGGIDYSEQLIRIARGVIGEHNELICGEAVNTPTEIKYDGVFSNSVFSYFPNYDYAERVLELMYMKSNYSIGIIDVHDIKKHEAFMKYRAETVKDYGAKYKGLDKLFFSKEFFINFAEKHGLNIRFAYSDVPGYWNNEFAFDVFITRG